jgi:hypothetical protein
LALDLNQLAQTGIIERTMTGWLVVNFAKRQARVPDAKRQELSRDRRRHEEYANSHDNVTNVSRNVRQINRLTESDTESDTESESDNSERNGEFSPLGDAFTTATGIVPYKLEQWTEAAQTMTRAGVLVDEIKQAIKKMQDDGLTISHLKSVVAVAIDIHSKRERGVPINNGQKKEETELEKVIRLGEERKQRIRAEQFGVAK